MPSSLLPTGSPLTPVDGPVVGAPRPRRWRRASSALLIGALGLAGLAACAPPVPKPATPSFPASAAIEPLLYEAAAKPCDPANSYDKPGPVALRNLLNATYGSIPTGVTRACDGSSSEHHEGRALDWMADYRNLDYRPKAEAVMNWMRATDTAGNANAVARRMGVEYWIYNSQMYGSWNNFNPTPYACGTNPTACHVDHIHFSFTWAGAYKQTSFWRGSTQPSVPTGGTSMALDSRSPAPALSPTQLVAGRSYTVEVAGTYRFGPGATQFADAECARTGAAAAWVPGTSDVTYGNTALDVRIGGGSSIGGTSWTPVVDTGGGCNTRDHRYRMTVRPRVTMPITALVLDTRSDNSGSMSVRVLPA